MAQKKNHPKSEYFDLLETLRRIAQKAVTILGGKKQKKDTEYFDLFEALAQKAYEAVAILGDKEIKTAEKVIQISGLEKDGDTIEEKVLRKLDLHVDPPFRSRWNTRGLVRNLDNIIDRLEEAIKLIALKGFETVDFSEQIALLHMATERIVDTLPCFRDITKKGNDKIVQDTAQFLAGLKQESSDLHDVCSRHIEDKHCEAITMSEGHSLDREEQIIAQLKSALNQCEDVGGFMGSLMHENL